MKPIYFIILLTLSLNVQSLAQRSIDLSIYARTWRYDTTVGTSNPLLLTDTFLTNSHAYWFMWGLYSAGTDTFKPGDTVIIVDYFNDTFKLGANSLTFPLAVGDTFYLSHDSAKVLQPPGGIPQTQVRVENWCDTIWLVDANGMPVPDPDPTNNGGCKSVNVLSWGTSVQEAQNSINGFTMHPNPASHMLTISFKLNERDHAQVYIKNLSGKTVYEKELAQLSGEQKVELDLPELVKGMYLLQLRAGDEVSTQKLLIE